MEKIKICAVLGPTASGKTSMGVEIAKRYNGEVVSCDSMQVYKGVAISTATPTLEEMQGIPHHLISFLELDTDYSVATYISHAKKVIEDIYRRGKLPILVGGTGLYAFSLMDNISFSSQPSDVNYRAELAKLADEKGNKYIYDMLQQIDQKSAEKLHENDTKRIIRALEIYHVTGMTKSRQDALSRENETPYDSCIIGLNFKDREKLYDRINKRVDIMLKNGLEAEAKKVYNLNLDDCTMMQAIGIKEFIPYFEGNETLDLVINRIKQNSRRYAKRQLTFFRRYENINWIYPDVENSRAKMMEKAQKILENSGIL